MSILKKNRQFDYYDQRIRPEYFPIRGKGQAEVTFDVGEFDHDPTSQEVLDWHNEPGYRGCDLAEGNTYLDTHKAECQQYPIVAICGDIIKIGGVRLVGCVLGILTLLGLELLGSQRSVRRIATGSKDTCLRSLFFHYLRVEMMCLLNGGRKQMERVLDIPRCVIIVIRMSVFLKPCIKSGKRYISNIFKNTSDITKVNFIYHQ
ncbi:MAG TPA: hypothetical protein VJB65_00135 [Patescibacteria group bacterium]|nr:hypothetical protein [Patescibacteria group bacterium]